MSDLISSTMIDCICPACGATYSTESENVGKAVKCPTCQKLVTAEPKDSSWSDDSERSDEWHVRKRTDARMRPASADQAGSGAESHEKVSKLHKHADTEGNVTPLKTIKESSSLRPEPEADKALSRQLNSSSWPIWLFVSGTVLVILGIAMFLKGHDLETESKKEVNISKAFIDHESAFAIKEDEELFRQLKEKAAKFTAEREKTDYDRYGENSAAQQITNAFVELTAFCKASSDEEKLEHVVDPKKIQPKMKSWTAYLGNSDSVPLEFVNSSLKEDLLQMTILMNDNTLRPAVFIRNKETGKWQLDWDAWVGHSSLTPEELLKTRPSEPVDVRILLSASPTYIPPFSWESGPQSYHQEAYIAFALEFPKGEIIYGYVDKYSELASVLTKLLYNGATYAYLSVHFPKDIPSGNAVIIDRLIHYGWMSPEAKEKFQQAEEKR